MPSCDESLKTSSLFRFVVLFNCRSLSASLHSIGQLAYLTMWYACVCKTYVRYARERERCLKISLWVKYCPAP